MTSSLDRRSVRGGGRFIAAAMLVGMVVVSPVRVAPVVAARLDDKPFLTGIGDPAAFKAAMETRLADAQQTLDRLLAVKGTRTIDNTLRPYDDLAIALNSVIGPSNLISAVHPDEKMRQAAEDTLQRARAKASDNALNRALYDALAAVDVSRADATTKYYVERELRDFRLAGVNKDEATRERVKRLQQELTATAFEFQRNIRNDSRSILVSSAAELEGLSPDFIARHKPDANGAITISTNLIDVRPVLTFAKNEALRKRLFTEWNNIAYPANIAVLDKMIATRTEIARLVGYETWAAYDMANRMSGSVKVASDFIDRVVAASTAKAERDYQEILARKRQDVPGATSVNPWENTYYGELVRRDSYQFDSQSVRVYFPFERVRQGVFDFTSTLFGVTYRPAKDAPVWHPSVQAYEMLENGEVIGRFYLDMHPRPNKLNSGAYTSTVRSGVGGRQIPEAVLVGAMPGGQPGDPGLLARNDVSDFFHEFGHLLHAIFAGRHQWIGVARVSERDFIEAPSQIFEEWTWDPATLATFARHYQTNEPIPAALVQRMRRANEFGKGLDMRQQMVLARISLSLHDRDPKLVDSDALMRDITNGYVPFKYAEGTHRQTQLGYLANTNYSAGYYTYMWSLVIVKDLFGQFDQSNLLSPKVARRYRETVLAPGGSKPAARLVEDFLGRPFNARAWEAWLNREPSS